VAITIDKLEGALESELSWNPRSAWLVCHCNAIKLMLRCTHNAAGILSAVCLFISPSTCYTRALCQKQKGLT